MKAESGKQKASDGNSGFQICNFKFQICDFKLTTCCLLLSCDGATTGSETNRDERRGACRYYHYLLGREYFRDGFWEGATGEYNLAIERGPNNAAYVLALYEYTRLAVKRRDYAESVVRLRRVIEKYPAHARSFYQQQ
jgi:tetratricopeptide (TPR) repeat protein